MSEIVTVCLLPYLSDFLLPHLNYSTKLIIHSGPKKGKEPYVFRAMGKVKMASLLPPPSSTCQLKSSSQWTSLRMNPPRMTVESMAPTTATNTTQLSGPCLQLFDLFL